MGGGGGGASKKEAKRQRSSLCIIQSKPQADLSDFHHVKPKSPFLGVLISPFSRANFAGLEDERIMLLRVCHLILLQEEQRQPGESPMWEEALAADFAFSRYPMCEIFISHSLKRELCALTFCGSDDDRLFFFFFFSLARFSSGQTDFLCLVGGKVR